MNQASLLLVDDDRHVLDSMSSWLRGQGYELDVATGREEAIARIEQRTYDLVLADIRLRDGDGFEILEYCCQHHPGLSVILITGYGTVETGIEAIRAGAFDLLTKPLIDEELEMAIDRALSQRQVIEENQLLKAQLDMRFGLENIVGHDHRMQRIFEMIDSVADTQGHRADYRRKRYRQVDDRPARFTAAVAARQAIRRGGLRCVARDAAGERTVRARGRGVHGSEWR